MALSRGLKLERASDGEEFEGRQTPERETRLSQARHHILTPDLVARHHRDGDLESELRDDDSDVLVKNEPEDTTGPVTEASLPAFGPPLPSCRKRCRAVRPGFVERRVDYRYICDHAARTIRARLSFSLGCNVVLSDSGALSALQPGLLNDATMPFRCGYVSRKGWSLAMVGHRQYIGTKKTRWCCCLCRPLAYGPDDMTFSLPLQANADITTSFFVAYTFDAIELSADVLLSVRSISDIVLSKDHYVLRPS
jgi:hypothetical protein